MNISGLGLDRLFIFLKGNYLCIIFGNSYGFYSLHNSTLVKPKTQSPRSLLVREKTLSHVQ